jgi:hypothetical protein
MQTQPARRRKVWRRASKGGQVAAAFLRTTDHSAAAPAEGKGLIRLAKAVSPLRCFEPFWLSTEMPIETESILGLD